MNKNKVIREFIYLCSSMLLLIMTPVLLYVDIDKNGIMGLFPWFPMLLALIWLVPICYKDFFKELYKLNEFRKKEVKDKIDKLHCGNEESSEYDCISTKLAKLRELMSIPDKDLGQAVYSPEYFVDLLISYEEERVADTGKTMDGVEVVEISHFEEGGIRFGVCPNKKCRETVMPIQSKCKHCGTKLIWNK